MRKFPIEEFKRVIESRHGGIALFVQSVPVHETNNALIFWSVIVHVFDLRGHPDGAFRAYIYSHGSEDGESQLFSILHSPEIYSPVLAARAAKSDRTKVPG